MIIEFLKAEYRSDRFSEQIREELRKLRLEECLLSEANVENSMENEERRRLLGEFRGYGRNRGLFENFPTVMKWQLCRFDGEDLEKIRYIDYSYWNELSGGTHEPLMAAEAIRGGVTVYDQSNDGFLQAAEYIKRGGKFSKLIFLTSDFEHFVIVEGHLRMTAYALFPEGFREVEAIVGICEAAALRCWM